MSTRFTQGDKTGAARATLRVPRAGRADLVATFALAVVTAAMGFASDFNPVAARPGPRLEVFKAEVAPIPNWAAVPASRRFVVTANTEAAYNAAAQAAHNATGGTRLVILPDFFNQPILHDYLNADPTSYVIVVPQRVVDGTYVLARGLRPNLESATPWVAPDWVPRLETKGNGGTVLDAVFRLRANDARARRLMVYACDVRVRASAPGDYYCFNLIDVGNFQTVPSDPALAPRNFVLSHCWTGGHRFDAAGNWRTGNVGRTISDQGSGVALLDFWVSEHGSTTQQGSDRGIYGSGFAQGPIWIMNYGTDGSCGGIAVMPGGSDVPNSWPNTEDMEVHLCHTRWTDDYCYDTTDQNETQYCTLLDASGKKCPWQRKNQGEIKTGGRIWYHHNVYDGHTPGVSTQMYAVTLKGVNQDGNGRTMPTYDVTFSHNVIRSKRAGGLGIISAGASSNGPPNRSNGIRRLTIYGNHLSGNAAAVMSFTTEQRTSITPARDWQIVRNVFARGMGSGQPGSAMSFKWFPSPGNMEGIFEMWGNVDVSQSSCASGINPYVGDYARYGFQYMFGQDAPGTGGDAAGNSRAAPPVPALRFRDWHTLSGTNNTAPDGNFAAGVVRYASLAAMGLTRDATTGLYSQSAPTLSTAGANASSVGPDWALLHAIVAAVTSGDVRSLLA